MIYTHGIIEKETAMHKYKELQKRVEKEKKKEQKTKE